MTKQEMLAEVEAEIRKDIPRLMELREGCKFHSGYGVETIVCIKGDKEDVFIFKDLFSNVYETNEIPQHYKIIGHDIMLNDVLEWFRLNDLVVVTQCNKNESLMALYYVEYDEDGHYLYESHASWNLPHACLKDQPEEVIKFLYNIKIKKWND